MLDLWAIVCCNDELGFSWKCIHSFKGILFERFDWERICQHFLKSIVDGLQFLLRAHLIHELDWFEKILFPYPFWPFFNRFNYFACPNPSLKHPSHLCNYWRINERTRPIEIILPNYSNRMTTLIQYWSKDSTSHHLSWRQAMGRSNIIDFRVIRVSSYLFNPKWLSFD